MLHMLGGLDNPTSGEVIIDGRNISGLSRDELTVYRRRKIGFVFQNYNGVIDIISFSFHEWIFVYL